jgi:hypothetical protein
VIAFVDIGFTSPPRLETERRLLALLYFRATGKTGKSVLIIK